MKRSGPLRRLTRLRPFSPRREALRADRAECRRTVLARARGRCEACPKLHDGPGRPAADVHELLPRSAGGSITDPDNCIAICRACHDWIHGHPAESGVLGLLIPSWEARRG
jgi:5-methylcytosine-specific restriction endonuclease McrA